MTKFVLNQGVSFREGLQCEFKSIAVHSDPVERIRADVDVYVVAYLNRGITGSIYWGITDKTRLAVGVGWGTGRYDDVNKAIVEKLGLISPKIPVSSYEIIFHDLLDRDEKLIPNRPIVEVKVVKPIYPRRQARFTNEHKAYIKTDAGRQEEKGERLTVLIGEIQEELKEWEAEEQKKREAEVQKAEAEAARKAEEEQKERKAEAQKAQGEALSKKKPRQRKRHQPKSAPTPFENPYNAAVAVTDDMFKGRDAEIKKLRSAIKNGIHTPIFGLQRMGKTSLVRETLRRVEENCIFVEIDLQDYGAEDLTYETLLYAIVTKIAKEISGSQDEDVRHQISMWADFYRPEDKHLMLDDVRNILKDILKYTRRKVVLFLDEFSEFCQVVDRNREDPNQNAPDNPQKTPVDVSLVRWFSSLMKDTELHRKLVFIIAVRPFIKEYEVDTQLQILKLTTASITLHHLRKLEAEALMAEPLRDKIDYEAGSIDYLYNLTAGHPYLIQLFLYEIVEQIQQDGRSRIEMQDITCFEEEVVSVEGSYDGQLAVLDSDYSVESITDKDAAEKGKGVLAVIAHLADEREDDGWVSEEDVEKRLMSHGMLKDEISNILEKLRGARIIEERRVDVGKLDYRISIPLLHKRYVRHNMYDRHFPQRNLRP